MPPVDTYEKYENVTATIWLYKGVHHFIQCSEYQRYKHAIYTDPADPWAGFKDNPDVAKWKGLCISDNTYFPLKKSDQLDQSDNRKFYIKPLECKLKSTKFRDLQNWGPESFFDTYCVDFERGDPKPQIRVHGNALFNITNFAQFENIEFTAVDNLALVRDNSTTKQELYQELIQFSPFRLCDFEKDLCLTL